MSATSAVSRQKYLTPVLVLDKIVLDLAANWREWRTRKSYKFVIIFWIFYFDCSSKSKLQDHSLGWRVVILVVFVEGRASLCCYNIIVIRYSEGNSICFWNGRMLIEHIEMTFEPQWLFSPFT
jgi:hypothetical protein